MLSTEEGEEAIEVYVQGKESNNTCRYKNNNIELVLRFANFPRHFTKKSPSKTLSLQTRIIYLHHNKCTMDLLDSIMSKMDKPPSVNDKHKQLMKEQQKAVEEAKNKERKRLAQFRKHIEERINRFIQNVSLTKKEFEPMDRVARSIVRDVADVAGLTTYDFGIEDVDRHVMVFKKEYPLTEEELDAYKNGEEWDPEQFKERAKLKEQQRLDDEIRMEKLKKDPGSSKFIEKYERLVGKETGKDAARVLEVNKQFGFVRSELKKDKRTIEETLADIRAKKQKREQTDVAEDKEVDESGMSQP